MSAAFVREMSKRVGYVLVGMALSIVLVAIPLFVRSMKPKVPSIKANSPRARGPIDAPIQIIEYSDFQCPACRLAQASLALLLARHPGKIRLVFQHFPLEGHAWSHAAHQAAECAADQNRFWIYHDRLYENQMNWSKSTELPITILLEMATEAGMDLDTFARCLTDPKVAARINGEGMAGKDLGVRSTPSFFVNGEMVVGVQGLEEKVEKLLKQ